MAAHHTAPRAVPPAHRRSTRPRAAAARVGKARSADRRRGRVPAPGHGSAASVARGTETGSPRASCEERMAKYLAAELARLVKAVVRAEIPRDQRATAPRTRSRRSSSASRTRSTSRPRSTPAPRPHEAQPHAKPQAALVARPRIHPNHARPRHRAQLTVRPSRRPGRARVRPGRPCSTCEVGHASHCLRCSACPLTASAARQPPRQLMDVGFDVDTSVGERAPSDVVDR